MELLHQILNATIYEMYLSNTQFMLLHFRDALHDAVFDYGGTVKRICCRELARDHRFIKQVGTLL